MDASIRDWAQGVIEAYDRIHCWVRHTPVEEIGELLPGTRTRIWAKREDCQETGSFKLRGATNRILQLTGAENTRSIVVASNGNHDLGAAAVAKYAGVSAEIYISEQIAPETVRRIGKYGATVRSTGIPCRPKLLPARGPVGSRRRARRWGNRRKLPSAIAVTLTISFCCGTTPRFTPTTTLIKAGRASSAARILWQVRCALHGPRGRRGCDQQQQSGRACAQPGRGVSGSRPAVRGAGEPVGRAAGRDSERRCAVRVESGPGREPAGGAERQAAGMGRIRISPADLHRPLLQRSQHDWQSRPETGVGVVGRRWRGLVREPENHNVADHLLFPATRRD